MSILSAFPRRPLELSSLPSTRIGWQPLLGLLFCVGMLIADVIYIVPPLLDDLRPLATMRVSPQATLDDGATCRTRIIVTFCDFAVTFRADKDGAAVQHKTFHYMMLFESIGGRQPPLAVSYDTDNPQRVSINWGRAFLINRLVTEGGALVLLLGMLPWFPLSYWQSQRLRHSLLAMVTAPRPVVAEFFGVRSGRYFATIRFAWTDPDTGARRYDRSRLSGTAQPFWLDAQHKTLLALAGPDGHAHALDAEFRPVILSDDERRVLAAAEM
jgi:hypothetical protein